MLFPFVKIFVIKKVIAVFMDIKVFRLGRASLLVSVLTKFKINHL